MKTIVERAPPRRWPVLLAMLLLGVLVAGVVSLWSLANASRWTEHTTRVRLAIAQLQNTVTDAETGARGYVVAGEPAFLDVYKTAAVAWKPNLDELRTLVADNPSQQQRIDRLGVVLGSRFQFLADIRSGFEAGMRGSALTPSMLEGKHTMDEARAIFAEMEAAEVELDETRRSSEAHHRQVTFLVLAAGVLAFIVMLGLVFVQRRDDEARRLRSLEVARAHALLQVVIEGVNMGITVQSKTGALVYANATGAAMAGFETPAALLAASSAEVLARFDVFDEHASPLAPDQLPSRAALRGEVPDELPIRFRVRGSRDERRALLRSVASRDATGEVELVVNFFHEVTERARRDEQRAFLLRAVDELNSSLDQEHTLAVVARMAVPGLADWCALDMLDGDRIKRVAVAHVDPDKLALVEALDLRYPADPASATGVRQIIRTGTAEFIADIPHAMLRAAAVDDEHLKLIDSLQLHSYMGVPLRVSGKTIGAITLAMAESDRRYTAHDLEFAKSLADRAALAIENARLFRQLEQANRATRELLANETERRTAAENASRFADVFIGILGHDLRNPLNAVLMAAQVMRHRLDAGADTKTLDRIESSGRRMSAMVTQLLDLARSRLGGGIELTRTRVQLANVINGVVDELRLVHPDRVIELDGADIVGDWDEDRLGQVLSNLVGNALEHGDPAKPVHVRIAELEAGIEISVRNEGAPIPAELLPSLFDPYRRVAARGTRSKGLGLGLFITQQIVNAHGGRIEVRSDDASTTFIVVLPREPRAPATIAGNAMKLST